MRKKRQIWINDNLPVLRCLDSESADLIYLDPPFNSGKQWESPIGGKTGRAKAAFKDAWAPSDTHIDEEYELKISCPSAVPLIQSLHGINGGSWWAYLIYMAARLAEMRRVLKPTGSIYYHCDPTMSHGVKLVMDAIFGGKNFLNDVVWQYDGPQSPSPKKFATKHDNILRYAKNIKEMFLSGENMFAMREIREPELGKNYKKDARGYFYDLPPGDYTEESLRKMEAEGRVRVTKNGKTRVKYYLAEHQGKYYRRKKIPSVWNDIPSLGQSAAKEKTGYPTQKPDALLERIDPFCGCGTAMVAAQKLKRQWIGIDISEASAQILRDRLPLFAKAKDGSGIEEFVRKLPKRKDIPAMTKEMKAHWRERLHREQKGRCAAPCEDGNRGVEIELRNMHLDHIVAKARGGQDVFENLQLLCPDCNSRKCDKGQTQFHREVMNRAAERKIAERAHLRRRKQP